MAVQQRNGQLSRRRKIFAGLAGIGLLVLALGTWAFWIEPRRLVVHESMLAVPEWPQQNDGLRVAVLADLHVGSPHHGVGTLRQIVDRVNELQPDVVLVLGDLVIQGVVGGEFVAPEVIATELRRLDPRHGTFAVLGNHDWWLDADRVAAALRNAGITLLEDTAQEVRFGRARFWLAGVSDYWEGRHDIAAALAAVPDGEPVIVFTHNPDIFPGVPQRVALTVAGHTHGGQVDLPLIGPPIVPSEFGQRYASGHIMEDGRHLFVSTGIGTSILPVRFRVPPAIFLLTLRSNESRK